jgi:hypothetical protein
MTFRRRAAELRLQQASLPPPHSPEAEAGVLASLFYAGTLAPVEDRLGPHHFYLERHRVAYRVLEELHREGLELQPALVQARLHAAPGLSEHDVVEIIHYLKDVPSEANLDHYTTEVLAYARRREILVASQLLQDAVRNNATLEQIEELLEDEWRTLREGVAQATPATERMVELVELLDMEFSERPFLFRNWLQLRRTLILFGDTHTGKSVLGWNMALCAARGYGSVLGHAVDTTPRRVGLFLGENDLQDLQDAYRTILQDEPPIQDQLFFYDVMAREQPPDLGAPEGQAWYRAIIETYGLEVVIFDTTTMLVRGNLSEREVAVGALTFFTQLEKQLGCTIIAIAHPRKGYGKKDDSSPFDKLYGAGEWGNCSGALTYVHWQDPRTCDKVVVHTIKSRGVPPSQKSTPVIAKLDEENLRLEKVAELTGRPRGRRAGQTARDIVQALHERQEELTAQEIANYLDKTKRAINKATRSAAFQTWVQEGFVGVRPGHGREPTTYRSGGALPPEIVGSGDE